MGMGAAKWVLRGGIKMSDTPETDAVIKNVGDGPYIAYLVHFARKLERERDEAREELDRVRKELVASNRGAETNAKVNQGLCAKLAEAERERDDALNGWDFANEGWSKALEGRDDARRELAEAMQRISVWHSGQVPNEDKEEA